MTPTRLQLTYFLGFIFMAWLALSRSAPCDSSNATVVTAREFRLTDRRGNLRGSIEGYPDGASMALFSSSSSRRVLLSAGQGGSALTLSDDKGRARIIVTPSEGGRQVELLDSSERQRLWIIMGDDGHLWLKAFDAKGRTLGHVQLDKNLTPADLPPGMGGDSGR